MDADISLSAVARRAGLDYQRVNRVLAGHAKPKPGEIEALLDSIDRLGAANRRALR